MDGVQEMARYEPLYIKAMETGLVQSRQNFILPADAYPKLENAYVWRERIKRKKAYQLLGRLQRDLTTESLGNSPATATWTFVLYSTVTPAIITPNPSIVPGSVVITDGTDTFTDQGDGTLERQDLDITSTINYFTGSITLNRTISTVDAFTVTFSYYPNLPVMGIRTREESGLTRNETIFFDTVYAYNYNSTTALFEEFLGAGTTWTGNNSDFFWTTNYWVGTGNFKIFWATNYSLTDPIRYTNGQAGTIWEPFAPVINAAGDQMFQCLALLPFRGRLLAFNTSEGSAFPGLRMGNRIRWAAIGNPFDVVSSIVSVVNANAWMDDIRGQGGFLDIPTNEDIISVGFVRDNLVIYCESSTWQLRYTGRSIAPFQIEKVNSELGATSTFSSVQFDTSLVGIGDKGIVECDSFKSERIDIKIPDFVFHVSSTNNSKKRIQGIRDFVNRLAFWNYKSEDNLSVFPNKRLVYNYENDSWAIFTDSLTALGTFIEPNSRKWINTKIPWIQCNFPWVSQPAGDPTIVGGNQQGFIEQLDEQTTNDPSLFISSITSNSPNATIITSPAHNLRTGFVIKITGIPASTPFATALNDQIFSVIVLTLDTFTIFSYDSTTGQFSIPQVSTETGYVGQGLISVRDNFDITSKKFNFLDDGQNIQMGYLDIMMDSTESTNPGAISLNIYLDYNDDETVNTPPQNVISDSVLPDTPDTFFNQVIPTNASPLNQIGGSKFLHRAFCGVRGNFITIQYKFNNEQMAGVEQELDVQIDAQILWIRRAGQINPQ